MNEFRCARGVHPASLKNVKEAYEVIPPQNGVTRIIVNISAEKIWTTFLSLASLVETPGFGILETPTNANDLPDDQQIYNDVYHLSPGPFSEFVQSIQPIAEWVIDDGLISCGFASPTKVDEVYIGPYKTFFIYATEPQKYLEVLEQMGLPRVDELITPRSGNSYETPGYLEALELEGKDFYQIRENQLIPRGWFLYERAPAR